MNTTGATTNGNMVSPARALARKRLLLALLLLFVSAVALVPIWAVAYPPLLDYPNHLARAFVLAHLHDPAYHFNTLYKADWGLQPYLGMDLLLQLLQRIFPMEVAGRVLLSICVLAVPAGAWFFLRRANPGEDSLALWAPLQAHGAFLLYGFVNYQLGLAAAFIALGLWLGWLERPSAARWWVCAAAFLVLYFTHLIAFGIAGLFVFTYLLVARRKLRETLLTGALFLPGALLSLPTWRSAGQFKGFRIHTVAEKLQGLEAFLRGFSLRLDLLTVALLGAFFLAAWWRNPEFRWNRKWLWVSAVFFLLYAALPWGYGEAGFVDIRVLPLLFVALLATARVGRRGWLLAPLVVLLFVVRTADLTRHFSAVQPELAGLARSFQLTPMNARVLPVVETEEEDLAKRPQVHFWAYGMIERGWLSPYLLHLKGVMPVQFRDTIYDPDGFWDLSYEEEPDWEQVREEYDYVWAYQVDRFRSALEAIGERVYTSGHLEFYRLRKP